MYSLFGVFFFFQYSSLVYFKEEKDFLPFSFDFNSCARRIQIQYEINLKRTWNEICKCMDVYKKTLHSCNF